MDTPEQAALREAVRDFCRRHAGPRAWTRLTGELGLTGLAVPECYGGAGAGLAEVAVAVEETGRVLLPAPYLSTALAGAVLGEDPVPGNGPVPGEGGAGGFLPGIASGALRAAFVFSDSVEAAGGRLTGVAHHVLDGAEADLFVVRAGDALFAVRATDAAVTRAGTLDQTRSQATVEFRAPRPSRPAAPRIGPRNCCASCWPSSPSARPRTAWTSPSATSRPGCSSDGRSAPSRRCGTAVRTSR